jgi:hypothetical protein
MTECCRLPQVPGQAAGLAEAGRGVEPNALVCFAEAMEPVTFLAIQYPAPICERCGQIMLTVTTVHKRLKSEPLKVISYRCQRCGYTLGDPRRSGIREQASGS